MRRPKHLHSAHKTDAKIAVEFYVEEGGGGPLWPDGYPATHGRELGLSNQLCGHLAEFAARWPAEKALTDEEVALRAAEEAELRLRIERELHPRFYLVRE